MRKKVCTRAVLWRAFDKAVRRKPPVVAVDAGPMQIQLREFDVRRQVFTGQVATFSNSLVFVSPAIGLRKFSYDPQKHRSLTTDATPDSARA